MEPKVYYYSWRVIWKGQKHEGAMEGLSADDVQETLANRYPNAEMFYIKFEFDIEDDKEEVVEVY